MVFAMNHSSGLGSQFLDGWKQRWWICSHFRVQIHVLEWHTGHLPLRDEVSLLRVITGIRGCRRNP